MSSVFLDTAGLIALWNSSDQWHAGAETASHQIRQSGVKVLTTRYVLLECANTVARTDLQTDVTRLRIKLAERNRLMDPTQEDWDQAWEAFDRGRPGEPGIVDLISFAVMRRLGIRQTFTNDRQFTAAGFETLF